MSISDIRPKSSGVRASIAALLGTALLGGYVSQSLAADDKDKLEEVQVTGSRIKRTTDFDTANPTTVVDSDYFKNMGIVNVGDAIKSLPSNVSNNSPTTTGNANFFAGSTIANLRGLNPFFGSRTLNLVDGQRFVPTNQGDGVDLNFIPSVLIERMDVVTGGASAAYGSGAVSGVNNIFLNHKLVGGKLDMDYGQSGHADAKDRHIAAAFGDYFNNDRGHFVVGFEHEKSDALGCETARAWCAKNQGFITNPAWVASNPTANGPQFLVANNVHTNLTSYTGVLSPLFGSPSNVNAAGTGVVPVTAGTVGLPGLGAAVVGGDGLGLYNYTNLRAPVDRNVATGSVTYALTDSINLKVNATYGKVETLNRTGALNENYTMINTDNAFLTPALAAQVGSNGSPFAFLSKDWTSQLNSFSDFNTRVQRISVGLDGKFGDSSWSWDGYYQYGDTLRSQLVNDNVHLTAYNYAIDSVLVNGVPECRVTQQIAGGTGPAAGTANYIIAQGCQPLNPFGNGQISTAAHNYAFGYLLESLKYTQQVLAFNTSGDLFDGIGAGAFKGAAGVEYRTERGNNVDSEKDANGVTVPDAVHTDYLIQYGNSFSGKVDVVEGYVETDLPLLKDAPFAKRLDLDLAVRESHYKNTAGANTQGGSATNDLNTWKASLVWDPTDWLRVRGSRSRDARAANFRELYYAQTINAGGIFAYCYGGLGQANDPCTWYLKGNASLKPEKSDTTTVGFVVTPRDLLPGFQFAADYFHIQISDAIQQANVGQVENGCLISNIAAYCALLTTADGLAPMTPSAANSPSHITPAGSLYPNGNITSLTALAFNGSGYSFSGIDFTGTYKLELADASSVNFRLLATKMLKQEFQPTPGQPFVNIVGQTGTSNSFLSDNQPTAKWTGDLSATYVSGAFSLTGQVRYVSAGVQDYLGCVGSCIPPAGGASLSDNHVPSYQVFGLNTSYTFDNVGYAKTLQLWGAIDNLTDKDPPFASGTGGFGTTNGNGGTNPVFYDTIGRYFRVGLRATF